MNILTDTPSLARWCDDAAAHPLLFLDTEFHRERTYYPQLCLIQLSTSPENACIVDPLAAGIDLAPLFALLRNPKVTKVLHAAGQDMEIFSQLMGRDMPRPVFDTQIAAMVCGFGESAGYGRLVQAVCGVTLDKSSQFTDWMARPLSDKQLTYALGDVTYLPRIYDHLIAELERTNRASWMAGDMEAISDYEKYQQSPDTAWQRIKLRTRTPRFVALVQALAEWREQEAIASDKPRQWVLKDDAISELAATLPRNEDALRKLRMPLKKNYREPILACIDRVLKLPESALPILPKGEKSKSAPAGLPEMLKALLAQVAEGEGIAPSLIAPAREVQAFAAEPEKDYPFLHGWRATVFGGTARRIVRGEAAIRYKNGQLVID